MDITYGVTEILGQREDMWLVSAKFFKLLADAKKEAEDMALEYYEMQAPYNWVYKQWGYHGCMVHQLKTGSDTCILIVECEVN